MLKTIRPVGNPLKYSPQNFNSEVLKPYQFLGFESGTSALAFALLLLKFKRDNIPEPEVLLPAYTCPDLISACLFAKLKPVLVDFEKDSPWMDIEQLQQKINSSTIAIIAINFLGIPERIPLIHTLKGTNEFEIIEDSAQGFPLQSPDKYWLSDLVITSFGRGKPLNLLGGGALLVKQGTHNQALLDYAKIENVTESFIDKLSYRIKTALFNILSRPSFYFYLTRFSFLKIGATFFKPLKSINTLPESILRQFNQNYLRYKCRKQPISNYNNIFKKIQSQDIVLLAKSCKLNETHILLRFPMLIRNEKLRINLTEDLIANDIGMSKMYGEILPFIEGVDKNIFPSDECYPNAELFSNQLITLPTHENVSDETLEKIESVFNKYFSIK